MTFTHLHVHTQYSLLDGAIRLDELLKRAKEFNMDAVAVTDHGTMFGTIEFYEKALQAGIKPLIGCECYVAPRTINDKTSLDNQGLTHLLLLAENHEGYKNLCKLVTIAQLKGFYYKPRIDKDVLKEHAKGLIGLSACLHGEIPAHIQGGRNEQAETAARFYEEILGTGNFFLEIQDNGMEVQDRVNSVLIEMSKKLSIPLVATNDCHYLNQQDYRAHDVLLCIQTGKTVMDADRLRFKTDKLYFKSPDEMKKSFAYVPSAIENTVEIAKRLNIEFDFNTYHFPKFNVNNGKTVEEAFEQKAQEGFSKRIENIRKHTPHPGPLPLSLPIDGGGSGWGWNKPDSLIDEKIYSDRLEYEISMIKKMGFAGYFLIVADFIRYAREKAIPVGPGRGSAAGSIVAYSLGITDIDPIKNGLIFERFLNPARKAMPDIDVDFCINGREDVYNYVVQKYGGGEYVAQIITFGTLKTRAVIRDVGRALNIPLADVDRIAKMVPDILNISLDQALRQEPKLRELCEQKSEYAQLMETCKVLEGLPRHASTHAAGVVISDNPLVDYLPLYRGKKEEVITQYDMHWVEKIGLVKFDFLGLRNLTVIADTLSLIKNQGKAVPDMLTLDLTDKDTYRLLCSGETDGVFQLESSGMKDLLVRMKPESFEDVVALVALYRPGPLESGMVDDFVDRRHGRKPLEYIIPQLEPILKETYGVIVYQEQVMKIAGALADYSMSEADDLRKAMGKKIPEIMAEHRERFVQGAVKNGIDVKKARNLFDLIEKFGGYGFNKSHSAAYAMIAFQTAYLKAHFPVEFLAALLTSEMHSTDGVVKYIADCRRQNIKVLPPDINRSDKGFAVKDDAIIFGLVAVKNVGEAAIEAIVEERKKEPFKSLFEFCERVDLRKVNKRVIESLIKCGAFDSTGNYRSQMATALEDALDFGQKVQREKNARQMSLFDIGSGKNMVNLPVLPKMSEWDEKDLLANEKESLGFYITGHPLTRFEKIIEKYATADSVSLQDLSDNASVRIAGIVRNTRNLRTKKGDPMAFVTLEDLHGSSDVTVFSPPYTDVYHLLAPDTPIFIQGHVQKDEKSAKVLADNIILVEEAAEKWISEIYFNIDLNKTSRGSLIKLHDVLMRHKGDSKGYLCMTAAEKTQTIIALPDTMKLSAGKSLIKDVMEVLGYNGVEMR